MERNWMLSLSATSAICFCLFFFSSRCIQFSLADLAKRRNITRAHTMTFKMHNANDHWKRCDDVYGSVVSVHDQRPINKQLFDWLWRGANYEWHHDVRHDNYLRWTIMCVRWLLVYCFLYFVVMPGIKGANSPVDECVRVWACVSGRSLTCDYFVAFFREIFNCTFRTTYLHTCTLTSAYSLWTVEAAEAHTRNLNDGIRMKPKRNLREKLRKQITNTHNSST